jgi:hypothetical protein
MSNYDKLTATEKCHYQAYARLREISDWEGFSDAQNDKKQAARTWLVNQRKAIWRKAQPKAEGGDGNGWGYLDRQARYDALSDNALNTASSHENCQLPTNGGTPSEKAGIAEREGWWNWSSVDDQTKQWRQSNADWATARRKQVWHLINDPGGSSENDRQLRYENLCVATKTGSPYDSWAKTHSTTTGKTKSSSSGKSSRSKCKDWLDSYLGVHENPDGSNKGNPQPSKWQQRVYGSDGVPWCACFAGCSAWDNGAKGTVTAGVANNVSLAKQGQGIYRGWTNDPSKVHAGDHAFIGSDHTGVIYDASDSTTVEGNTSASGGSQWNGGQVAKKKRGWGYWSAGFGLVDFPDD